MQIVAGVHQVCFAFENFLEVSLFFFLSSLPSFPPFFFFPTIFDLRLVECVDVKLMHMKDQLYT